MESPFESVLNLSGKTRHDVQRVHRRRNDRNNLRYRTRDLTSELVKKYTDYNPWNTPAMTSSKHKAQWEQMQLTEANRSRDRFIETIGNKLFRPGRGRQHVQADELQKQYNLLEAIRQGRPDMMDIGTSGGRPGYTYNAENVRDPGRGLPPEIAIAIHDAWENANRMNPIIRGRNWVKPEKDSNDVGNMSEDYVESKIPVETSDYMDPVKLSLPDTRFTHTQVGLLRAAQLASQRNENIFAPGFAPHQYHSNAMPPGSTVHNHFYGDGGYADEDPIIDGGGGGGNSTNITNTTVPDPEPDPDPGPGSDWPELPEWLTTMIDGSSSELRSYLDQLVNGFIDQGLDQQTIVAKIFEFLMKQGRPSSETPEELAARQAAEAAAAEAAEVQRLAEAEVQRQQAEESKRKEEEEALLKEEEEERQRLAKSAAEEEAKKQREEERERVRAELKRHRAIIADLQQKFDTAINHNNATEAKYHANLLDLSQQELEKYRSTLLAAKAERAAQELQRQEEETKAAEEARLVEEERIRLANEEEQNRLAEEEETRREEARQREEAALLAEQQAKADAAKLAAAKAAEERRLQEEASRQKQEEDAKAAAAKAAAKAAKEAQRIKELQSQWTNDDYFNFLRIMQNSTKRHDISVPGDEDLQKFKVFMDNQSWHIQGQGFNETPVSKFESLTNFLETGSSKAKQFLAGGLMLFVSLYGIKSIFQKAVGKLPLVFLASQLQNMAVDQQHAMVQQAPQLMGRQVANIALNAVAESALQLLGPPQPPQAMDVQDVADMDDEEDVDMDDSFLQQLMSPAGPFRPRQSPVGWGSPVEAKDDSFSLDDSIANLEAVFFPKYDIIEVGERSLGDLIDETLDQLDETQPLDLDAEPRTPLNARAVRAAQRAARGAAGAVKYVSKELAKEAAKKVMYKMLLKAAGVPEAAAPSLQTLYLLRKFVQTEGPERMIGVLERFRNRLGS